ncbi:hypothetical protein [Salipaludibacillus aurantiacus]|uniref:ABC-2 type transport system permease protein n=1 Tax=Salipaludibacillus aurantiacus TaxID=1601833 RepID=A0A1H9VY85_9BACI|nr:hypothetical protein [Salipaludibacillus aurantiacus]SES26706.1 ABC-2 type transport system permease protein [Salipaludibacillus aurantiacus]
MKSIISLWNKALFTLQLRTVSWFSILLTLLLFVMLPVSILVREIRFGPDAHLHFYTAGSQLNALSEFSFPFQLLVFFIFPVLLGIVLLNFTTKKEAAYFMHSLPFTRQSILTNTYLAGAVALLAPIMLTGLVLGILVFVLDQPFYSFIDVLAWTGLSLIITVLMFILTMAVGVIVGNGFLHGALTYTVIIVPALIIVLALTNLQYFISGLALTSYTETLLSKGIFFARLLELYNEPFTVIEYFIYAAIAVLLVIGTYGAYMKRPSEASDQAIVFPIVRSIFLYGLTFFAMLLGGLYFTEALRGGIVWTLFGYILGAFFAYTVLQMILQKAIRLSWPWKGFAGYMAVIILLMIPVNIGGATYENNVPASEDVLSVAIHSSFFNGYEEAGEPPRLMSDLSIEQVTELHRQLKDYQNEEYYRWNTLTIDYALKDGSTLKREYSLSDTIGKEVTEDLRNNDEFKQAYDPVFKLRDLNPAYASVFGNFTAREQRITDPDELNTLITLLEQDAEEQPSHLLVEYEELPVGQLYFQTSKRQYDEYIFLTSDYTRTIEWLKENNSSESLVIAENIPSATVIRATGSEFFRELDDILYNSSGKPEDLPNSFQTSDKNELEELLAVSREYYEGDYVIILDGGSDHYLYLGFDQEDAPDFVLEKLE